MYQLKTKNLNLQQIAESGQCFRWSLMEDGAYEIAALGKAIHAFQEGETITLSCDEEEFHQLWHSYFDLDTDYRAIMEEGRQYQDEFLNAAMEYGSGIRILRQDRWEMVVSFIISQNNNIPRIRKIIGLLCGDSCCFPRPEQILALDLSCFGLGYRDKYLKSAAEWWIGKGENIKDIKGVGIKVENCIRLFGYHDFTVCPMDTWMKKILEEDYKGIQPEWMKSQYAGVFQQYTFFYKRHLSGR